MTESIWLHSVSRLHCGHTMTTHRDGSTPLDRNSQFHWKKTCIWHCTLAHVKAVLCCALELRAEVIAEMMQNKPVWTFHLFIITAPYTGAKRQHCPWPSCFQEAQKISSFQSQGSRQSLKCAKRYCSKVAVNTCGNLWVGLTSLHTDPLCCQADFSWLQAVAFNE